MKDFLKFIETLRGKDVYIQTHNFPDPDAISSAYGLQQLLLHYDIPSVLCYEGKIDKLSTRKLTHLFDIDIRPYEELVDTMTESSPIICVDSQKHGGNILDFKGNEVACIDHHPTYTPVDYEYSDVRITGSCASLIAEYYRKLGVTMSSNVATALLYGIKMDTAQFSRGVTKLDIDMFAYLFPYIDQNTLSALEKNTMEMEDLRAYGAAINNIELYDKTGFAMIPFACPDAMIAMVSDFILSLEEVDISVIYSYRDNGIKFSVRSMDPKIHAGELTRIALASVGNGGGHASMAGGFIPKEKSQEMGDFPDSVIKQYFMDAVHKLSNS